MNRLRVLAVAILAGLSMMAQAEDSVPKHLQVARDIVANVKPDNNVYSNKPRYIRFPGDLFTSEYHVRTDCSGFVEAVLDKAYNFTPHFSTKKFSYAYSIIDWVDGIDRGETFDKIEKIQDLKAGDLVLWKFIIWPKGTDTNGHVLIVDSAPTRVEPQQKPYLDGAIQWKLGIVDSNIGPMSRDDTRYVPARTATGTDGNAMQAILRTGAGRGTMYLYTDEEGKILGQAPVSTRVKVNRQDVERHIIMARVRPNEK